MQRNRNDVELFFDRIVDNNESIIEVDLVGNKRFLTLTNEEKIKAAESFVLNTHVTKIKMDACAIDDEFAIAFAHSLKVNETIKVIWMDGNALSGIGITAIFKVLAENTSVEEI